MVPKSRFVAVEKAGAGPEMWPILSGQNLDRVDLEFPRDFAAEFNLMLVPFLQRQQLTVNTWLPYADGLERGREDFRYYEIPTISRFPGIARTYINEGMRSGIRDPAARERTVTIYIDVKAFMNLMNIPGRTDIRIFLVNRAGEILWRASGAFTDEKGREMLAAIEGAGRPEK